MLKRERGARTARNSRTGATIKIKGSYSGLLTHFAPADLDA